MPLLGGLTLVQRLRVQKPRDALVPIVIVSSDADRSLREREFRCGANASLRKPVNCAEFPGLVRRLIETYMSGWNFGALVVAATEHRSPSAVLSKRRRSRRPRSQECWLRARPLVKWTNSNCAATDSNAP